MTTETASRTPLYAGLAAAAMTGYLALSLVLNHVAPGMLPWMLGRALGVGAYLLLTALTALGLWLRHPWRVKFAKPGAAASHHAHALLASATLLMLIGHIVALAVDRFAGVGWSGAFVPGASGYRPLAIALGTISLYSGVAVGVTAALAGWVGAKVWLPIHRLAANTFALAWIHGLLAGSDAAALRGVYVVTGVAVLGLAATRRLAQPPRSMLVAGTPRGGRRDEAAA
jgi:predicted ferric reductase